MTPCAERDVLALLDWVRGNAHAESQVATRIVNWDRISVNHTNTPNSVVKFNLFLRLLAVAQYFEPCKWRRRQARHRWKHIVADEVLFLIFE